MRSERHADHGDSSRDQFSRRGNLRRQTTQWSATSSASSARFGLIAHGLDCRPQRRPAGVNEALQISRQNIGQTQISTLSTALCAFLIGIITFISWLITLSNALSAFSTGLIAFSTCLITLLTVLFAFSSGLMETWRGIFAIRSRLCDHRDDLRKHLSHSRKHLSQSDFPLSASYFQFFNSRAR